MLLSAASFYGFESPVKSPIWRKQVGSLEWLLSITSQAKGLSMYCSPKTGAAQLTTLPQQACVAMLEPF